MNELLSVVISNYNKEPYLEQCINSVIKQTYRPIEIVIVDDCSRDESRVLLEKLADFFQEIRLVFLEINQGVSNARNEGIRKAKGKYITVLDADDFYWSNKKLEQEMELLDKLERQGINNSVAFSKLIAVNKEGKYLWEYKTHPCFSGDGMRRMILSGRKLHYPREYCYKKELHDAIGGYDTKMNLYEDLDYLLRLSECADFYCTSKVGNAYRITDSGLSSLDKKKTGAALEDLKKRYLAAYPLYIRFFLELVNRIMQIKSFIRQKIRVALIKGGLWKPKS